MNAKQTVWTVSHRLVFSIVVLTRTINGGLALKATCPCNVALQEWKKDTKINKIDKFPHITNNTRRIKMKVCISQFWIYFYNTIRIRQNEAAIFSSWFSGNVLFQLDSNVFIRLCKQTVQLSWWTVISLFLESILFCASSLFSLSLDQGIESIQEFLSCSHEKVKTLLSVRG